MKGNQPVVAVVEEVCCEMVKDGPGLVILLVLIFLLLAVIALTGFIALLLD